MRKVILLVVLGLVVASCSGDDDAGSDSTTTTLVESAQTTSSVATETTQGEARTTTAATATTTTAATATTTTTTVAPGPGVLALTRVVFEPVAYVTITNVGNGPIELGNHWLCQRPAYVQLPRLELLPGDTVAIGLGDGTPPDLVEYVEVFELGAALGAIAQVEGEAGLYANPFFEDATALLDYVEWGSSGHGRSAVAVQAGIWADGAFVEVPEEAMSISSSGTIGGGPEDWFADIGG